MGRPKTVKLTNAHKNIIGKFREKYPRGFGSKSETGTEKWKSDLYNFMKKYDKKVTFADVKRWTATHSWITMRQPRSRSRSNAQWNENEREKEKKKKSHSDMKKANNPWPNLDKRAGGRFSHQSRQGDFFEPPVNFDEPSTSRRPYIIPDVRDTPMPTLHRPESECYSSPESLVSSASTTRQNNQPLPPFSILKPIPRYPQLILPNWRLSQEESLSMLRMPNPFSNNSAEAAGQSSNSGTENQIPANGDQIPNPNSNTAPPNTGSGPAPGFCCHCNRAMGSQQNSNGLAGTAGTYTEDEKYLQKLHLASLSVRRLSKICFQTPALHLALCPLETATAILNRALRKETYPHSYNASRTEIAKSIKKEYQDSRDTESQGRETPNSFAHENEEEQPQVIISSSDVTIV